MTMEEVTVPRKAPSSHEPAVPIASCLALGDVVDVVSDLVNVFRDPDDLLAGFGQLEAVAGAGAPAAERGNEPRTRCDSRIKRSSD